MSAFRPMWMGLVAAQALALLVTAQPAPAQTSPPAPPAGRVMPPPLPAPKAPVAVFRDLLAMTQPERERFLASRPAETRQAILDKLKEYDGLSEEQRELRLRVTELRYYLFPLLSTVATNRPRQLDYIPEELRPMIEVRLRNWDQLPAEKQRELLENEAVLRLPFGVVPTNLPPQKMETLQASIRKWQQLNEPERAVIVMRFQAYFDLRPEEQQKLLETISSQERQQIQKTLQTYDQLEPVKRAQCIRALDKLWRLSPAERQEFFHNVERWKSMSPAERKAWRNLVMNLSRQPPYPPGFRNPPPPPLPSAPAVPSATTVSDTDHVATNR